MKQVPEASCTRHTRQVYERLDVWAIAAGAAGRGSGRCTRFAYAADSRAIFLAPVASCVEECCCCGPGSAALLGESSLTEYLVGRSGRSSRRSVLGSRLVRVLDVRTLPHVKQGLLASAQRACMFPFCLHSGRCSGAHWLPGLFFVFFLLLVLFLVLFFSFSAAGFLPWSLRWVKS